MDAEAAQRGIRDVVTTPERRAELEGSGLWNDETLVGRVTEWARVKPDSVAVIDQLGERSRTYAELVADAAHFAGYLQSQGVRAGDVVSIQLPNWYETVVVGLGVLGSGCVLNPLLPIYREHELHGVLSRSGSALLVTPKIYRHYAYGTLASALRESVAHPFGHLEVDQPGSDPAAFSAWLGGQPESELVARPASAVSELIFTSGTESTPKAIMHTEQTANFGMRALSKHVGFTESDVVWMPSPIGHSTGFNYGVRMALYHGAALVLQDIWSAADAIHLIENARCTYTLVATTFVSDLLAQYRRNGGDLTSMRLLASGGASIPPELVRRAHNEGIEVLRIYGSTEVLCGSWNRPDSPVEKRINTDGCPLPNVEFKVRAEDGSRLARGAGELFVRSPSGCVGFLDDPERTSASFDAAGWIRTGDVGTLDDDGYFAMVSRKKEILIRGGLNVAPREVEELIATMPGIRAVAVVPLPDARLGEIGCACVVPDDGFVPRLDSVVAHLRKKGLAAYKLPERLEILSELPTTSTGKVQKFEIIRMIAESDGR
jgi:acyl-CoA synthetase (AMP-forming)/AMP-acid ligase II